MKLGIMQPYFFPYLGYFDLIHKSDKWIVFDTVQYIRHGWINRNRILHPETGWKHIIVPLKNHSRAASIKEISISENEQWQKKIIGQIQHYKKRAPYFYETFSLLEKGIYSEKSSILRLNVNCLDMTCNYLGIEFRYELFSEMNLHIGPVESPGEWALKISEAIGADEYINPPGGVEFIDAKKFEAAGIALTFRYLPPLEYNCNRYPFIPNLSIIDLLMWNTPHEIKSHLEIDAIPSNHSSIDRESASVYEADI